MRERRNRSGKRYLNIWLSCPPRPRTSIALWIDNEVYGRLLVWIGVHFPFPGQKRAVTPALRAMVAHTTDARHRPEAGRSLIEEYDAWIAREGHKSRAAGLRAMITDMVAKG